VNERKRNRLRTPALAAIALVVFVQVAFATHPRPKGATPLHVSLVPAFKQCTAPNTTHAPPLSFQSCAPPVQESNYLTVGTPDANGAPANSIGAVHVSVAPPSIDNEVRFSGSITDVRCLPGTDTSVCNSPNAQDGPDYSGQLEMVATIRISDHFNGPNQNEAATVRDLPNPVPLDCVNTADTSTGGVCMVVPQASCPPNCSISGRRTLVEFGQIEVFDGGKDGANGTADNTVFMRGGIFIP
jgi:hypothetical protein